MTWLMWLGIPVALAGCAAALHKIWQPIRRFGRAAMGAMVTLAGRDAIHDPSTGKELSPAQPSLGVRLAAVEHVTSETKDVLSRIADLMAGQHAQDARMDTIEHRVEVLEGAATERAAQRIESAVMWKAVDRLADPGADLTD